MRILKATLFLLIGLFVLSCNKDNENNAVPAKPYAEQAPIDDLAINKFLDEYHMVVSADLEDVSFKRIAENPTLSSIRNSFTVLTKTVKVGEVDHKMYYIKFAEGTGGEDKQPCPLDSVYVRYKGEYIYTKKVEKSPPTDPKTYDEFIASQEFERSNGNVWFVQANVVKGWQEFVSLIKSGNHSVDGTFGEVTFSDFGSGVVFMPSALAYYNRGAGTIPNYSPLIFNISLKKMKFMDHDLDGVLSKDEEYTYDSNTKMYVEKKLDTDGDGRLNWVDSDDDGDLYLTKYEKSFGDSDNDGKLDYLDSDDDNNGILTKNESRGDKDNDGTPDYRDKYDEDPTRN